MTEHSAEPSAPPGLLPGVGAAIAGAVLGAAAWAVLVSVTSYKIGFAAIGVGALTGYLAGRFGGGAPALPWIAAAIGLVGCVLGDLLTDAHQVSVAVADQGGPHVSMLRVFREMVTHPDFGWEVYKAGFDFLDLVFYAIAANAAWRLAASHQAPPPVPAPAAPAPTGEEGSSPGRSPFDLPTDKPAAPEREPE